MIRANLFARTEANHTRIQMLAIAELPPRSGIDIHTTGAGNVAFKRAPKAKAKATGAETVNLDWEQGNEH